jgi:hypothetical protein
MGALPPRYSFALNPYTNARFTMCPGCQMKTRVRKLPLAIHIEGLGLFVLRKTCRLCVACDMIIVHQHELDPLIGARLRKSGSGRALDYLVLGTVDSDVWRRGLTGGVSFDELVGNMADFRTHMQIQQIGRGWGPAK